MIAIALAIAAATPLEAVTPVLAQCTSADSYSREALQQGGWKMTMAASLKAPGQSSQTFEKDGVNARLSLRSSNAEYVACTASFDLKSADEFPSTVSAVAGQLGASEASDDRLSDQVRTFLEANELTSLGPIYSNASHQFLFELRQFNGRNLIIIYVFRKG